MPKKTILSEDAVISKIYLVRGQKVMLDKDLAILYNVSTGNLNKGVNRNRRRFPEDFMFQLTSKEQQNLMFQIGISSWGGTRKLPYAFTEQGVAMLSSVLKSERAISVNIHIIRIFTRMRQLLMSRKDILLKLEKLEGRVGRHDADIQVIFSHLKELLSPKFRPTRIGFRLKGTH